MEKDELIKIANYVILNMEPPHDLIQTKIITYFKKYKERENTIEEFKIIKDFLVKKEMLIEKLPSSQSTSFALYKLTEKGKEIVSLGSIEKYRKKLSKEKCKTLYYNLGKDYLLPVIAIVVSIIAIVKSYQDDFESKIETLNNEIYQIKQKQLVLDKVYVKNIDSLNSEINKLKKK